MRGERISKIKMEAYLKCIRKDKNNSDIPQLSEITKKGCMKHEKTYI